MSRKNKIRQTTVRRGFFGEKIVETEWIDKGSGCGVAVVLFLLFLGLIRGC